MNRTQKLKLNTGMSLLSRLAIIVSGLVLPRLILSNYGVETHGLVSSINQFLGIIVFLDLGVGSVVKSALYRPLAKKDANQISIVIIAAKKYFQKIALILILYVVLLFLFYPLLVDSTYSYLSTGFLIGALAIGHFGQYYFGIVNELLLSANQQDYVQLGSEIVVVILNLLISAFLIYQGATIQIVKLASGLVFLIRPLFLTFYVRNHFDIDYSLVAEEDPLPQKWNGMGQHLAYSIQNNSDIVIVTIFSTLNNVSIYSVYNMVVSAVRMLVASLTTGIQSFFGDLYANDEIQLLNNYFDKIEWIVHTIVIYLYGMTAVLINPFIMLYTSGVESISYYAPAFSFLLVVSSVAYSLRTPYHSMILSAGHFRQTQMSSFIEAGLNLFLSIILVNRFGLIGVAIGTLVSMAYRTLYLIVYLSRNIVFRPIKLFIKHLFVDSLSFGLIMAMGSVMTNNYNIETLVDWIVAAVVLGILTIILFAIINLIFYKDIMNSVIKSALKRS